MPVGVAHSQGGPPTPISPRQNSSTGTSLLAARPTVNPAKVSSLRNMGIEKKIGIYFVLFSE